MREDTFRQWLRREGYAAKVVSSRLSNCRRVARAEQVDLDQEFEKDQLSNLISHLTYTADDAARGKDNPTNIEINGSLVKGLGSCKRAIKLYGRFCMEISNDDVDSAESDEDLTETEDTSEDNSEVVFGMESQLRDFIAQNIHSIPFNGKKLSLSSGGVEYHTAAGVIDILATDAQGNFVIFELKRGRTPDHVIGQLVRYMGCVKQTLGKDKQVYGVIVAKTIRENLHYAKAVVPNVSLLQYEVKFELNDAVLGENSNG